MGGDGGADGGDGGGGAVDEGKSEREKKKNCKVCVCQCIQARVCLFLCLVSPREGGGTSFFV